VPLTGNQQVCGHSCASDIPAFLAQIGTGSFNEAVSCLQGVCCAV